MKWYLAKLVYRIICGEGNHKPQFDEQLRLIYAEDDLPEDQQQFIKINAKLAEKWPVINSKKQPPNDADEWQQVKDKLQYLEEA